MDFMDKPITDILVALALQAKLSIVPDETVTGNATFYFPDVEPRQALASFLAAYNLYMREEAGVIYISKIDIVIEAGGTLSINADDVDPSALLRAISKRAGKTVLYDSIPKSSVTVHSKGLSLRRAVEIVMARFTDYQVTGDDELIQVRRLEQTAQAKAASRSASVFKRDADGSYSIDAPQARLFDALDELIRLEGREYSLLMKSDVLLERLRYQKKPFEKMLELVLEPAGADYAIRDGVLYVFELSRKDPSRKLKATETVSLTWIGAQDAVSLLSQDLSNSALYRIDKAANALVLTGTEEELRLLKEFLSKVDRPLEGKEYIRYRSSFLKAKEIVPLIPPRLLPIAPIMTPDEYVFLAALESSQKEDFEAFLAAVDRREAAIPIVLKYLKPEELLKNLPPSVSKEDVLDAGAQNIVFFTGSAERRERFLADLALIDRPKPQIRYDILVVQYTRNQDRSAGLSLEGSKISSADGLGIDGSTAVNPRDAWSLVASLANVFNIKFDILSLLGINFAAGLDASLTSSDTQVLTDTSLTALSGQEVKFQSTSSVRYIQPEVDTETGKTKSTGPTVELSHGFVISLNGWLSGDGMVTMAINASLSKKTGNDNPEAGLYNPTTERVVSTQLRARAGEAVVISGLLQRNEDKTRSLVPLKLKDSSELTELAIYLVPRIVREDRGRAGSVRRMQALYDEFCAPSESSPSGSSVP
jgi:type II secretory pathway component GspD/PulD (secretin)